MRTRIWRWPFLLVCAAVGMVGGAVPEAYAIRTAPDPCKLITMAELQAIVGALQGAPKPGDIASGDVSCEYTPVKGPRWIDIRLHDGDLVSWRRRQGGPSPVMLPEFGKDAFANADDSGSADVFAQKGGVILRVSLPMGPQAVETAKAITRKALLRL
jgi:hypothetical protein